MKTFKYIALVICSLFIVKGAEAQYKTAIGVRAGGTSGLVIKQKLTVSRSLEGILQLHPTQIGGTVTLQKEVPTQLTPGLNWYYGLGGHAVLYYDEDIYQNKPLPTQTALGLGVDGILGLEFIIPSIPFILSIDLKPMVEVQTSGGAFFGIDPGMGVKLRF